MNLDKLAKKSAFMRGCTYGGAHLIEGCIASRSGDLVRCLDPGKPASVRRVMASMEAMNSEPPLLT